ncbi:hypothetical protein FB451DRAFT_1267917 [Mycena latifolia]|nr:hypothetical protein FB451DRAFT_1267917 [Mycena latifolia]
MEASSTETSATIRAVSLLSFSFTLASHLAWASCSVFTVPSEPSVSSPPGGCIQVSLSNSIPLPFWGPEALLRAWHVSPPTQKVWPVVNRMGAGPAAGVQQW